MANDIDKAIQEGDDLGAKYLGIGETAEQRQKRKKLEDRQTAELGRLDKQKEDRLASRTRKSRGRASLISGAETGLSDTLG